MLVKNTKVKCLRCKKYKRKKEFDGYDYVKKDTRTCSECKKEMFKPVKKVVEHTDYFIEKENIVINEKACKKAREIKKHIWDTVKEVPKKIPFKAMYNDLFVFENGKMDNYCNFI